MKLPKVSKRAQELGERIVVAVASDPELLELVQRLGVAAGNAIRQSGFPVDSVRAAMRAKDPVAGALKVALLLPEVQQWAKRHGGNTRARRVKRQRRAARAHS